MDAEEQSQSEILEQIIYPILSINVEGMGLDTLWRGVQGRARLYMRTKNKHLEHRVDISAL